MIHTTLLAAELSTRRQAVAVVSLSLWTSAQVNDLFVSWCCCVSELTSARATVDTQVLVIRTLTVVIVGEAIKWIVRAPSVTLTNSPLNRGDPNQFVAHTHLA